MSCYIPRKSSVFHFDILVQIMPYLGRKDLWAFMRAGADVSLYDEGIKIFLRRPDSGIIDAGRFHDFLKIILVEPVRRARFLRQLGLSPYTQFADGDIMDEFIGDLLIVLTNACNLEFLELDHIEIIQRKADSMYGLGTMEKTLKCLQNLRQAEFRDIGRGFENILQHLDVPLEDACLIYSPISVDGPVRDASHLLGGCTGTLCKISMNYNINKFCRVFPELTALELYHDDVKNASQLFRSFPNLRDLRFHSAGFDEGGVTYFGTMDVEELRKARARNWKAQQMQGRWPNLEVLDGPARTLYALGMRSHVRCLRVDMLPDQNCMENLSMFQISEILRYVLPERLKIDMPLHDFLEDMEDFFVRLPETLRYAEFHFVYGEDEVEDEHIDLQEVFDELSQACGHARLTHIAIAFENITFGRDDDYKALWTRTSHAFLRNVPRLSYFRFIDTGMLNGGPAQAWRVVETQGGPRLEDVPCDDDDDWTWGEVLEPEFRGLENLSMYHIQPCTFGRAEGDLLERSGARAAGP
ncbi:hypothetical protein OBBRIDRAFT_808673 [Obba rivulosa]|uniref:Uncharacterized protein n=1 Tax=Obba rivulosa TaxID=1052685 RepID=A0A8E2AG58_9APHY|nr:hypothetical protein OBBRIDRAFT_808673 [Obba rivulosa]